MTYSYIKEYGNDIYIAYYDKNGKKQYKRDRQFKPFIFITSDNPNSEYKTFIDNKPLKKMTFGSIKEMKDSLSMFPKQVVHGMVPYHCLYQKIREEELAKNADITLLRVLFFDIEVFSLKGFPTANKAEHEIVTISALERGTDNCYLWYVSNDFSFSTTSWFFHKYQEFFDSEKECFSTIKSIGIKKVQEIIIDKLKKYMEEVEETIQKKIKEFNESIELKEKFDFSEDYYANELKKKKELVTKINYVSLMEKYYRRINTIKLFKATDEKTLLNDFFKFVKDSRIDILCGFNSTFYDIPYLINRAKKIIPDTYQQISPFGKVVTKQVISQYDEEINTGDIVGIQCLDYKELDEFYTLNNRDGKSLDFLATEILGWGKIEYEGTLGELWINDKQKYCEYNFQDVELLEEIDANLDYINLMYSIIFFVGGSPDTYQHATYIWEAKFYNEFLDRNISIPSSQLDVQREGQIKGAYVHAPKPGIFEYITSVDLTSLYPRNISMMNMSHEMIVKKLDIDIIDDILKENFDFTQFKEKNVCLTPFGLVFSKKKKGIITEVIDNLFFQRKEHKKQAEEWKKKAEKEYDIQKKIEYTRMAKILNGKQGAEKVLLNSFYGALQVPSFALYNKDMAEAITTTGQVANRFCANKLNQFLNKVLTEKIDYIIGGDTDSLYINMTPFVRKLGEKEQQLTMNEKIDYIDNVMKELIMPKINKIYGHLAEYMGVFNNTMEMKREVIAYGGFWKAKKNYCMFVYDNEGIRYEEPQLKVVGIRIVRSDTPKKVKTILKDFLIRLLKGGNIKRAIKRYKQEILSWTPEELAIPQTIKVLNDYYEKNGTINSYSKGAPFAIKGAWRYNNLLRYHKLDIYPSIKNGDRIYFCYLKEDNPWGIDGISFVTKLPNEFSLHQYIDKEQMYERIAGKFFHDMLESVGKLDVLEDKYQFNLF